MHAKVMRMAKPVMHVQAQHDCTVAAIPLQQHGLCCLNVLYWYAEIKYAANLLYQDAHKLCTQALWLLICDPVPEASHCCQAQLR